MTRFEQIGVNYQYLAQNTEQAVEFFTNSCNVCVHNPRCLHNDCRHCAIQQVHNQVVAILGGQNND